MIEERGLFDEELRLRHITDYGDPLERLNERIDWELFRPTLERCLRNEPKGPGGRPPYDYVMMFKILILQNLYNLADGQTQYQIMDRLSFMRFLGLTLASQVPDEKTIWLFREKLTTTKVIKKLFQKFRRYLVEEKMFACQGSIVDASIVEVPRQRNSKKENDKIKGGNIPEGWEQNKSKLRQKDIDARWTKKYDQNYYGYKNHVKVDRKSKLITEYEVTDASVHDSQVLPDLLDKNDSGHELYADSAYSGEPIAAKLKKRKIRNRIHRKGYRNSPLSDKEKSYNHKKSSVRVRVEHVFGFITNTMRGMFMRVIGIIRARTVIGLRNLVYNMCRFVYLQKAV